MPIYRSRRELILNHFLKDFLKGQQILGQLEIALRSYLGNPINIHGSQTNTSSLISAISLSFINESKSKKSAEILAKCVEVMDQNKLKVKKEHSAFVKSIQAIEKCNNTIAKVLQPVHCKLCKEVVEIGELADHSFMCFEREIVHEEVIKINKMIVKLSIGCANLKTKLRKLVLI